ncbi:probable phospholipid-transporting ATPase VD isoform X2 [Trichogramma pretiosum]|uniref:probable phospholipid-transporting ATPase VD isoform X1 n=1 Tax=Trichogramma pretiosum TaxID=7493 RepID=UPI0006C9DBAE|nr:probable phospholipid-transporting ATPase VD isoform X1 [Trichogramma pretiosum]XP_014233018.1 probable phospholipid-transporting ATPase VD isoform X1 [Trichogramma pretiosum]XP_014233027.1 probable phospholipid-transporting ATPase VD isoform X1 [Trichogramma pretiosum]XP_023318506.1 probable phospholipid-transporting ATPase VD isoform X1 [Trichogramma pretiosum]XP_023318507.1 probable phospholipid-transporting ATPase VD isoform X2 [Trichogramma pretiosum]
MSENGMQEEEDEVSNSEESTSLYIFPNTMNNTTAAAAAAAAAATAAAGVQGAEVAGHQQPAVVESVAEESISALESISSTPRIPGRPLSAFRTHARSASHGGVLLASSAASGTPARPGNSNWTGGPLSAAGQQVRPSALKKPGHQRAFSQGQVVEVQTESGQKVSGHSRVGSKTDFILPTNHREDAPRPHAANKTSFRGHSRQASRSESIYTIRRTIAPSWWRRLWAHCCGSTVEEPNCRIIRPSHLPPPKTLRPQQPPPLQIGVIDNRIRTTKYNALNFLPRNLMEQFHRVANLYFIFIVLLNWVPAINAFGKEIAMIPVLFVLGVTALKDFVEDRRRLASDKRVNNSTCRVYIREGDRYVKIPWKDVKVGDLVHLSNNELVPADMLLLRSSDPQGFAFLDTCNLDGETNLKQRQVIPGFLDLQATFKPSEFRSFIEIDKPSTKIYRFNGAVVHPNGVRVPVSTENLLLRECVLKNTDFIEGIVVYVGHETKAMLNNGGPRYKRSRLEKQMNYDVIWCVVILVILCIVGAAGCRFWLSTYASAGEVPFLENTQDPAYEGMLTFWTFVIILQVMIPLSLYVTIEMAKLGQVFHIMCDKELYDPETDRPAECRAFNITEELGQIQYVFSDKTGTLTQNKMTFRRCAVGGQDYAHVGDLDQIVACTRLKEDLLIGTCRHRLQEFLILLAICNTVVVSTHPHHDNMNSSGVIEEPQTNGTDTTRYFFNRYMRLNESNNSNNANNVNETSDTASTEVPETPTSLIPPTNQMLTPPAMNLSPIDKSSVPSDKLSRPRLLNLSGLTGFNLLAKRLSPSSRNNSSSIIEENEKSLLDVSINPAIYEAESPDELALVHAARAYDVKLIKRTAQSAIISLPDKSRLTFEILKVLPFDSTRRCMSIIVKHPHTNEIVLYSKGADSTILSSLNRSEEDSTVTAKVRQQLQSYARQGLRTLVMARRTLSAQEYEAWRQKHAEIEMCCESRERKLRESFASLESQMSLLGITGIEDKLEVGVPEAITSLVAAGIVVWVLTGDKPETAVNIAYSACLFTPSMQILRLQARSKSVAENLIHNHLESIKRENSVGGTTASPRGSSQRLSNQSDMEESERLAYRMGTSWQRQRALVVDGKTLTFILDPRSGLTGPFLELTRLCSSVLACRATPLQKAYIVKVVKEQLRMRTLAIGDGANDVSMIQTADVGIGVSGLEGTQAVMASDFAIARFPMLARLLLIHGHWCYDRLSRMILYFFYKNATFVFLIFWYQMYCGFSGTVMIDQIYLMLYNLIFTSLPPLVLGIYDQIASANVLMETPRLYERGRLASAYQPHSFWITISDALYQSLVIFFLTEAIYHDTSIDIWEFGSTITTSCIVIMLLHVSIETRSWTLIHIAAIIMSIGSFFVFGLFYNAVCVNCLGLPGSYWVLQKAIGRPIYWLTVIITSVMATLPRFVYKVLKNTMKPDIIMKATMTHAKKNERMANGLDTGEAGLVAGWSRSTQNATIR